MYVVSYYSMSPRNSARKPISGDSLGKPDRGLLPNSLWGTTTDDMVRVSLPQGSNSVLGGQFAEVAVAGGFLCSNSTYRPRIPPTLVIPPTIGSIARTSPARPELRQLCK
jgi:hypothetical protein